MSAIRGANITGSCAGNGSCELGDIGDGEAIGWQSDDVLAEKIQVVLAGIIGVCANGEGTEFDAIIFRLWCRC